MKNTETKSATMANNIFEICFELVERFNFIGPEGEEHKGYSKDLERLYEPMFKKRLETIGLKYDGCEFGDPDYPNTSHLFLRFYDNDDEYWDLAFRRDTEEKEVTCCEATDKYTLEELKNKFGGE